MSVALACMCAFTASARIIGDSRVPAVAEQITRVSAALEKLTPFQIAGCLKNAQLLPLIGLSVREGVGLQVAEVMTEAGAPLFSVQSGDLLMSVDGKAIKWEGSDSGSLARKARSTPLDNLREQGRTFTEIYKTSDGKEVSVVNPVRLKCSADQLLIGDGQTDRAATRTMIGRDYAWLSITASRLARLDDDQLLAFLAWNHAFVGLRHESNADAWEVFTLLGNGRPSSFIYSSGAHEKMDWATLTMLRAMNANLKAYGTMLAVVDAFDKSAAFSFLGSNKFIDSESGASPFGGAEKQIRLAEWVKLLEQDAQAPSPASLKYKNVLLSKLTWSGKTVPLTKYQTVGEVLQAFFVEAEAKDLAESYMANFDPMKRMADIPIAGHLGKARTPPDAQMLFVHHPTKRLLWVGQNRPQQEAWDICTRPTDCSLIAIGPHVVARPSTLWAQELSTSLGTYKAEEFK